MNEDIVLVAPGCGAFAKGQFPGRKLITILDDTQLDVFLASSRASSLTFCGSWLQLTVRVSRALAEWASENPDRGCGLYLATDASSGVYPKRPMESERVYELADGFPALQYDAAGRLGIDQNDMVGRLLDQELPAPAAVVLTGHGSEYCIRLGSNPIILPSFGLGGVIFLNCCSSLRLGDSCIPQEYLLAALLFSFGSAVIGSFRNLHTSPHYATVFAEALLAGHALGRIVNRLNAEAHRAEPAGLAFQLLGDPVDSFGLKVGSTALMPSKEPTSQWKPPQLSVPSPLMHAIEDNVRLERLSTALVRWVPESCSLSETHSSLEKLTNYAGCVDHAWHMVGIDEEQLTQVVQHLERQSRLLQLELLAALARTIQTVGWIQTRYASRCRRSRATSDTCARCGGICHWTRYEPFASYLPAIDREECDYCGSTQERIGDGPVLTTLTVEPEAASVAVTMPPLPNRCHELLLFHRMPGFVPLPWPDQGGKVHIPYTMLNFFGRQTLVAAVLGPHCLTVQYYTFFVFPDVTNEPMHPAS